MSALTARRVAVACAVMIVWAGAMPPLRANAQSQFGMNLGPAPSPGIQLLNSDQRIEINPIFAWNADQSGKRQTQAPSSDCRLFDEGKTEIMSSASKKVVRLSSFDAGLFLDYAYYGSELGGAGASVKDIFLRFVSPDEILVYTGNEQMNVICGFEDQQRVNKLWAEAGIAKQRASRPAPDLSLEEQMTRAFRGKAYEIAEGSLSARGFRPLSNSESVTQRCGLGLETICRANQQATCVDRGLLPSLCGFVWQAETGQSIMVVAQVDHLSTNFVQLTVTDVRRHE